MGARYGNESTRDAPSWNKTLTQAPDFQTLTTSRFRALLAVLRADGVDVEAALAKFGLEEGELRDPLYRMPRHHLLKFCYALGLQGDVGILPLRVADELEAGDLDLLGHLLLSAKTLGDAAREAERSIALIHDGVRLRLRVEGQHALWTHRIAGGHTQLPAMADFAVALITRWIRELTDGQQGLSEVRIARPLPADAQAYRQWFKAPVHFDAEINTVVLPKEALEFPLPRANASLHAVLQRQAVALLAASAGASGSTSFLEHARLQATELLNRTPSEMTASNLATRLRISERTLRRRLTDAGTHYAALLDDIRREQALSRILDPRVSLKALAAELGFAGPSSLGRAFMRWTGQQPTAYKANARRQGAG